VTVVVTRLTATLADRYRVVRELGAGGMATVYLAHDLRHERDVAIKVLHDAVARAGVRREDFRVPLLHELEPSLATATVGGCAISGAANQGDGHDVPVNADGSQYRDPKAERDSTVITP
jgi:hypothetical protein